MRFWRKERECGCCNYSLITKIKIEKIKSFFINILNLSRKYFVLNMILKKLEKAF